MIAAKHVGKAHATSIFLFRERQIRQALPNERPKPDAWTGRWHLSNQEYTRKPAKSKKNLKNFVKLVRTAPKKRIPVKQLLFHGNALFWVQSVGTTTGMPWTV